MNNNNPAWILLAATLLFTLTSTTAFSSTLPQQAVKAFENSEYDRGIELATQVIDSGSAESDVLFHMHNMRGSSYNYKRLDAMEEGNRDAQLRYERLALEDFDKAIAIKGDEYSPYFSRGLLHKFTQRYKEAIADLEKAQKLWESSEPPSASPSASQNARNIAIAGQTQWKVIGMTIKKEMQDARIQLEAETTGPRLASHIPKFDRGAPGAELIVQGWLANWDRRNEEAMDLFEQAANMGNADAMSFLAMGYQIGHGRPQNADKWMEYIRKSIEHGRIAGYREVGAAYRSGRAPTGRDYAKAISWFKKGSAAGDLDADYDLANMHIFGQGMEKDIAKGKQMLESLAKGGYAKAQWNLGMHYLDGVAAEEGDFYDQDLRKAYRWIRKAAKQGYIHAQNSMSIMYQNGTGVLQDYKKAFRWLEQAAMQGDPISQYNLGVMYWNGKGVEQDRHMAKVWWKKSAEWGNKHARKALQSVM